MRQAVAIENIEEMRRREGIEDAELWEAIRVLRVGDFVRLTLLSNTIPSTAETRLVRITRIRGDDYRGKLADKPSTAGSTQLPCGAPIVFTGDHIHSVAKKPR